MGDSNSFNQTVVSIKSAKQYNSATYIKYEKRQEHLKLGLMYLPQIIVADRNPNNEMTKIKTCNENITILFKVKKYKSKCSFTNKIAVNTLFL